MKRLRLKRVSESLEATLGVLLDNGTGLPLCLTLENPYKENAENISCIPKGIYRCCPYSSEKYPNVYEVQDVPGRTKILFHTGNTESDTKGCILVGNIFGLLYDKPAVLASRDAFSDLHRFIGNESFDLIIE